MPLSFGFLSPYPPRQHWLDTFTRSLAEQLTAIGHRTGLVRMVDAQTLPPRGSQGGDDSHDEVDPAVLLAAAALASFDVAVVQFELGSQRGVPATTVGAVAGRLRVPMIVVVHAAHTQPTDRQREVFHRVVYRAAAVVTTSDTVRRQLIADYAADPATVVVIPYGTAVCLPAVDRQPRHEPPTILTWGLLAPGDGIESMIDAMTTLRHLELAPHYLVVGPTHPQALTRHGETYRHRLMARTIDRDVARLVSFRVADLTGSELSAILGQADVVALPYAKSRAPSTSEVLADTMAAGKPVVATAFADAVQLLSDGAGIVVPHDDPAALADALRRVLTEPDLAARMGRRAIEIHPERAWSAVARRYQRLAQDVAGNRLPAAVIGSPSYVPSGRPVAGRGAP